MSSPKEVVEKYIKAHESLDLEGMLSCLDKDYVFKDEAFPDLDTVHSKGMWAMFLKNKEKNKMKVVHKDLRGQDNVFESDYVVTYVFNGRPIENPIHANLTVSPESGLIISQLDSFPFYKWSVQSLGVVGVLLGWTPYIQAQVQGRARKSVEAFVKKEAERGTQSNL